MKGEAYAYIYIRLMPKKCELSALAVEINLFAANLSIRLIIPIHNKVVGGYIGFTLFVRPSIHPARIPRPLCRGGGGGGGGGSQNPGVLVVLVDIVLSTSEALR